VLATEAAIETGTIFDADDFHNPSLDNFNSTVHHSEDYDSDVSTESNSSGGRPLRSAEEKLFSSYRLLRLNTRQVIF
jgi:hypothetical protein